MQADNIFSGLNVVDLASFVAGPGAAVILSDFGANVIKVEPPHGDPWRMANKTPIQPRSDEPYQWHLANRNKRGIALDLKSPSAAQVLRELAVWADVFIVNTPHDARKRLGLEFEDVAQWNDRLIYADLTGFGEKGPDAGLPGFDITSYWARSGLLSLTRDAGLPPTWPVSGSGDNATAVGLYSAIVTALYRRERTGKGAYVTTSLLAEGVWSASVSIQAALAGATFPPAHDRAHPANAAMNVYRAADDVWFVLIITPDKVAAVAKAIGRADLLTDPRFADPQRIMANMPQLTAILDAVFGARPMADWRALFTGVDVTFGEVRGPQDVIADPQLRANDIVVPLEGAGGTLTSTINSPIQIHGVTKATAQRAPGLGEHTEEILGEIGFDRIAIDELRAGGAIPGALGKPSAAFADPVGWLFFLELSGGRIHAMRTDGTVQKVLVEGCHLPDGIVVDAEAGHIYWTNMGVPNLNDGSIERADLDGSNRKVIIPQGATHTPKQLHLEKDSGKLYWCDREGMRVMRANLDGSGVETLVQTGEGEDDRRDATNWCVGITVDPVRRHVYWTQKGPDNARLGRIFRAGLEMPEGDIPTERSDIEVIFEELPEPIDLEVDLENRILYWTDRGNPPDGNTVNRAAIEVAPGKSYMAETIVSDLMEGIGVALDVPGNRLFATDLGGSVYTARLDGSGKRMLVYAQGNLAGIAFTRSL